MNFDTGLKTETLDSDGDDQRKKSAKGLRRNKASIRIFLEIKGKLPFRVRLNFGGDRTYQPNGCLPLHDSSRFPLDSPY